MLTRMHALSISEGNRVLPDRLSRRLHAQYLSYAKQMLDIYKSGIGSTRRELHQRIRAIFADEPDCPTRRIDSFCKLLDDAGTYEGTPSNKAAEFRKRLFREAAKHHPLVRLPDRLFENQEDKVKTELANQLGTTWQEIDDILFADVIDFHRLREFPGFPSPAALLSRYNVAQVQVALFDATRLVIRSSGDFKTIVRYAKLARLMHSIRRLPDGRYQFTFDGPSSVLRETRRYGVAMAKFLPALLACQGWQLRAEIPSRFGDWRMYLNLSVDDGLSSHLPPPSEFDSKVEETFASKWGDADRDGWHMIREGEVLEVDQKVYVPDFAFRHADGRTCLLEVVGFWTPEYLTAKRQTILSFPNRRIVLAVQQSVSHQMTDVSPDMILYKTSLKIADVLQALERM